MRYPSYAANNDEGDALIDQRLHDQFEIDHERFRTALRKSSKSLITD